MKHTERARVERQLALLESKGEILKRQDRVDRATEDPPVDGAIYFTDDIGLYAVLTAIAIKGYAGYISGQAYLNSLIEGN